MSDEKVPVTGAAPALASPMPVLVPQNGVIVFGAGLNEEYAMVQARAEGYKVTPMPGYAILYKEVKK